jgi:ABC-type glycerol-3-phosphate transport system substrate-binding protein
MMKRWQQPLALCLVALALAACSAGLLDGRAQDDTPSGRVLLWHSWTGEEVQALEQMLASYRALNPNVEILPVAVDPGRFSSRLSDRSNSGLGPDLILTEAGVIYELAQQGLIRDLAPLGPDISDYLATAVSMVSDGERIYGLPFAASTEVLFYNRDLVQTPPETLAELMQRVDQGQVFAQSTNLPDSYWGVGAHDGRILDSQRRLLLGLGGFENWLDFLATARTMPGFLFQDDQNALRTAFIEGGAAYWVGNSSELPDLAAAMGPEQVGVALLPSGPNGSPASPILGLDAFALSQVSSDQEFAVALDLAEFLTNAQNQLSLATYDLGRVPVNVQVRLTPSLPANTLTVARQTRTAEPVRFVNQALWKDLSAGALGLFEEYRQVANGILNPRRLIDRAIEAFDEVYGIQPRVTGPEDICPPQPGAIAVWHTASSASARLVEQMAAEFMEICPGTEITLSYVPDQEIKQRFAEEAMAGGGPDLLHASSRWLAPLAEQGLLMDLTELAASRYLQQFLPNTIEAMRYGGQLYGIPESVLVLALFFNTAQVNDAPITLPDLAQVVQVDRRAALPMGFFWSYWGLEPYGGFRFDSYNGEILDTTGLVGWLQALRAAQPTPGMDYLFDASLAEDAFAFEEAAYLVSGPWSLPRLSEEVGRERFRVALLPNGPVAPGSPLLQVRGFMVNANAGALSTDLALAFSRFANLPENQQRLTETGAHVTASVNVNLDDYPELDGFRRQAKVATILAENSNFVILEQLGDQLYRAVLEGGADPVEAVEAFVEAVHAATGAGRPGEE